MNTKGMKNCNFRGKSYNKMLNVVLFSKLVSIGVLCDVWICACARTLQPDCTIHINNV